MSNLAEPPVRPGESPQTSWIPGTARDREAVREQMGRVLSSSLFRNSKRFPPFLRYTVLTVQEFLRSNAVRYTDALTLALISGELRARSKPFKIRQPAATGLKDLRDGPVVLIGGLNNAWSLKLSEGLRFTLATDAVGAYVRDRDHPESRQWQPDPSGKLMRNLTETFGLISRIEDPATGHSVLTISGILFGTATAAECLIDASCLEARRGSAEAEPAVGTFRSWFRRR